MTPAEALTGPAIRAAMEAHAEAIDLDARASAAKLDDLTKRLRAAKKAGADASPDDHGDIPF